MQRPASALVVLGMHRSGTSAITGTLGLCGAWVGEQDELTGAGHQNLKGFFERRDLRDICDSLLFSADADWWKLLAFSPENVSSEVLEDRRNAFSQLVRLLGEHGTWVIKEPRLCLLFSLLRPAVADAVCILSVRNPLDVAKSLRARNGFSIMQGLALWEAYARASLAASAGLPRTLVCYEALVAAPVEQTTRLVQELEALGVRGLRLPDAAAIEDFVTPELRRERSDEAETIELLEPSQRDLWERMAAGEDLPAEGLAALSPRSLQHLRDLEAQHTRVLAFEQERATLAAERRKLKAARDEAAEALAAERQKLKAVRDEAGEALAAERQKLKAVRDEAGEALAAERQKLKAMRDEAGGALAAERQKLKAVRDEASGALAKARERAGALEAKLRKVLAAKEAAQTVGPAAAAPPAADAGTGRALAEARAREEFAPSRKRSSRSDWLLKRLWR